jgi:hypothetical protein
MNNFAVVKHLDEYRIYSTVIDIDGTILDVSGDSLDLVAYSLEDLQVMVETLYNEIVERPVRMLNYDDLDEYDASQFEFDRYTPVDEMFK